MSFSSKKSFTIIEILIIIGVLSVGLLSIITVLRKGFDYVQQSRQKIIALDLAREGIEAVYQIRNTNWKRWSAQKEECWLKTNPMVDENTPGCEDDEWMQSGSYILDTAMVNDQRYFLLTGSGLPTLNLGDGIGANDLKFHLCILSGVWSACPGSSLSSPEGSFYREIRGYGLFEKDLTSGRSQSLICGNGLATYTTPVANTCGSNVPKEYVFCSRVVYGPLASQEVSLCGSITNFAADTL